MNTRQERLWRRGIIKDLRARGCRCCDETESAIMDLHHVNPEEKCFSLGKMSAVFAATREEFAAEVHKVIAICPNCHRRHHVGLLEIPEDESEPCRFS